MIKFLMYDSSLKTVVFGLKPRKWLIFNSPALKGGIIDMLDNQGFSHIVKICGTFLDRTHVLFSYEQFQFHCINFRRFVTL